MINDKELKYLWYMGLAKAVYWASIVRLLLCVSKPFHTIWGAFLVILLMVVAHNVCQSLSNAVSVLQVFPHDGYYSEASVLGKSYWVVAKDKLEYLYQNENDNNSLATKYSRLKTRVVELEICLRGFKRNNGLLDKVYILVNKDNQVCADNNGNAVVFTSLEHAESWSKRNKNLDAYIMPVEINMGGEDRA